MAEHSTSEATPAEPQARHVIYCGICTLPPEYCEFGGTAKKCREWLEKEHADMYEKLYSEGSTIPQPLTPSLPTSLPPHQDQDQHQFSHLTSLSHHPEAVASSLSTLSVEAQKRAQKDSAKKEAKAAQQEKRAAEDKAAAKVLIKRVERNKRKYVTAVAGLEAHGLDLKKVAKEWGKKFATGSSVTKTASGSEEVVVQGDNSDEIFDWITEVGNVPEDNVEMVEDKKKKAG